MKERIYTIPVTDAFKSGSECPFCTLYSLLERQTVDFILGPSYMEEDMRTETNKQGFCAEHFALLYNEQNRLGLALIVQTHLHAAVKKIQEQLPSVTDSAKRKLFAKKPQPPFDGLPYLTELEQSCYICSSMSETMERYYDTFLHLWHHEKAFKVIIESTHGYCLSHFNTLLARASKKLSPQSYKELCDIIVPQQLNTLNEIEADIDLFVKKFDYRYTDEPWGNAKDALPRAIGKFCGKRL